MSGSWIFVCGPSGAGKDSVIASAREMLSSRQDIVFARRMVTRPAQQGSEHDPVAEADFLAVLQAGGLSWHWQAHGFYYGISRHYADEVEAGRIVVVNGSREHVNSLAPSPGLRVVQITAGQNQLAERLAQRGRDAASAVTERLARNTRFTGMQADCVIVNDAELAVAGQRLANYLAVQAATETLQARSSTAT
ncbi:phosphonate metabolism protein/1,5-bisphosphokinase (PRPP-forming) PhnN [Polaromonas sp. YR568]|uniref:phosphonate metabolism protein/1,5-bisphosphokinase (PRPP-forming) PhnN n=1 Tax=Polaromonas sp. YR568 TaxID=1855301 RepID=UPI00398BF0AE